MGICLWHKNFIAVRKRLQSFFVFLPSFADIMVTSPTDGEVTHAIQLFSPGALSEEAAENRRSLDCSPLSIVQAELGSSRIHVRVPVLSDAAVHGNTNSIADVSDGNTNSAVNASGGNTEIAAEELVPVAEKQDPIVTLTGVEKDEDIWKISETDIITVATENNRSCVSITKRFIKQNQTLLNRFEKMKTNSGGFGLFDHLFDIELPIDKFVQLPRQLQKVADNWKKASKSSMSSVVFGIFSSKEDYQTYHVLATTEELGQIVLLQPPCVIFVAQTEQLMDMYRETVNVFHESKYIPFSSRLCNDNTDDMFPFKESKPWQIHPALILVPKDRVPDQGFISSGQVCAAGPLCVFIDPKGFTGSVSPTAPSVPPYFVCRVCKKHMHACCGYFSIMVSFVCRKCDERDNKAEVVFKSPEKVFI